MAASYLFIEHVLVEKEHCLGLTFDFLFVCTGNITPHFINWDIVAHYKEPRYITVAARFTKESIN